MYFVSFQAGNRFTSHIGGQDLCSFLKLSRSMSRSIHNSSTTSLQALALQEELADARERNVQLTARLQQREADLSQARKDIEELTSEKEKLRGRVGELEEERRHMAPAISPTKTVYQECFKESKETSVDQDDICQMMRMAEKKKIKRMDDFGNNDGIHQRVTGSDLSSVGVRSFRRSLLLKHTRVVNLIPGQEQRCGGALGSRISRQVGYAGIFA